jgi:hypothetical protein
MAEEVELGSLDLRYQGLRMRDRAQEGRLLSSIAERGIEEALEGVAVDGRRVLLNGFKRYRCARKLNIHTVPYASLGEDEAAGIVALLRLTKARRLNILEQAGFVEELRRMRSLSVAQIAELLSRSKAWVSMRLGLMEQMSETIRHKLLSGVFPSYAYLYTLPRFMRINGVSSEQIEEFVTACSGKKLSVRDIEQLAHGYFLGPESFRQQVLEGHIAEAVDRIRQMPQDPEGCTTFERGLLKDLQILSKYIQRVIGKSESPRLKSRAFHAQANLLTAGILSHSPAFQQSMRRLHDKSGQA